jgi:hypothetical protein
VLSGASPRSAPGILHLTADQQPADILRSPAAPGVRTSAIRSSFTRTHACSHDVSLNTYRKSRSPNGPVLSSLSRETERVRVRVPPHRSSPVAPAIILRRLYRWGCTVYSLPLPSNRQGREHRRSGLSHMVGFRIRMICLADVLSLH